MNDEQLAGKLHLQLVNDIARMQLRVIEMRALQKEFGDNAVYTMQGRLVFHDSLTRGPANIARWIETTLKDIEEYSAIVRDLEKRFADKNEQDIKGFVDYIVERDRPSKDTTARKTKTEDARTAAFKGTEAMHRLKRE